VKTELNFLELHFLVQELQVCVGARLQKVYESDGLLLQFHKSGVGKFLLRVTDKVLWLSASRPAAETISGVVAKLRKVLEGKKLTALEQSGSERIVKFTFQTQKETFFLIVELFGKGNAVLTDVNNKILAAQEERAWKDREIRRGIKYVAPPAKKNLFDLQEEDISTDEKKLARLGFGKLLAKEILVRGGDFKAYNSLLAEKPSPRMYSDGELSPVRLKQYDEKGKSFASFSELIDSKLGVAAEKQKEDRVKKLFEAKRAKLLEVIELQTRKIEDIEDRAANLQRKGELVYEHYQELKEILDGLNKLKLTYSLQEIRKKVKGHAKIKDVNPKTGDIILEI
jgi:predicted ribosome quality control (RQC) complex YloA/Tae2 family protein